MSWAGVGVLWWGGGGWGLNGLSSLQPYRGSGRKLGWCGVSGQCWGVQRTIAGAWEILQEGAAVRGLGGV